MYLLELLASILVITLITAFYNLLITNFGHNFIQGIPSSYLILMCMCLSIITVLSLSVIGELYYQYNKKYAYKKWPFKNKEAALKFINDNDKYVRISDKKKSELSALLFFSWKIENDSDLGNVILKRGDEVKILNLKDKAP